MSKPEGRTLFFYSGTGGTFNIFMVPLSGEASAAEQLIANQATERNPTLSPDGNWLAYQFDESGRVEIYVRPYPDIDTARIQISVGGGSPSLWSRDGSELFYLVGNDFDDSGALMAVAIDKDTSFSPGIPELLFENNFFIPSFTQSRQFYDVSANGQRF